MNNKKFIIGIVIAMLMVAFGAFITMYQPSSFCTQAVADEVEIECITNEAGTFCGAGYYEVGQYATLKAEMNPGWAFDSWISIDESGNLIETLSYDMEYTFKVEQNIIIQPKYHQIVYSITFANGLSEYFTFDDSNITNIGKDYHYGDEIKIIGTIKEGCYVYDLDSKNIKINNKTANAVAQNIEIINQSGTTGFKSFELTLLITDNVNIDIEYMLMHKVELKSANSINIDNIMSFIDLGEYYSILDATNHIYLARPDRAITLNVAKGDAIYNFKFYKVDNGDAIDANSKSHLISTDTIITFTFEKNGYAVSFNSYLINTYGAQSLMDEPLYDIDNVMLEVGQEVGFAYDEGTKKIIITEADGTRVEYDYPANLYGYSFKGFAIDGTIISENTFTLVTPEVAEIQLIFEYIKYTFNVELIDPYFTGDVETNIVYDKNELVKGTNITVSARTTNYVINGWSWNNNPKANGYVNQPEAGAISSSYTFTFEPTNETDYILYLDVDYKYLNTSYTLKNGVTQNVIYDIIKIDNTDLANKKIIFSDSENLVDDKIINYQDTDITSEEGKIIIETAEFGDLTIEGNVLSYIVESIKVSSISKDTNAGVDIYTFKKYTYFADMKVSVIDEITLTEDAGAVQVVLKGTSYNENGATVGEIINIQTTKIEKETGVYNLNYQYSTSPVKSVDIMTLYMDGSDYDYIILQGVEYLYNGSSFKLDTSTINIPEEIESTQTKGVDYNISLNNLLPNSVLIYMSNSTNATNFEFTKYTNKNGSSLSNYSYTAGGTDYRFCILNTSFNEINLEYRQLSNNITLVINNESAYSYENIGISVQTDEGTVSSSGNIVSALDREIITITIDEAKINPGYSFIGFEFDEQDITMADNKFVLTITMEASIYANKTIIINFTAINYTLNVNYVNAQGEEIEIDNVKGLFKLQGEDSAQASYLVNIEDEYVFESIASEGYYTNKAYIGTEAYILWSLQVDNLSKQSLTTWTLNIDNFYDAIITSAGASTEVNLYVYYAIHTYAVKVYFEISENASLITYPALRIGGVVKTVQKVQEGAEGAKVDKWIVYVDGIEHGTQNLSLKLDVTSFMIGTLLKEWRNESGDKISQTMEYVISSVESDKVYTIELAYQLYTVNVVAVDEEENSCNYGITNEPADKVAYQDTVRFSATANQGYVLKGYYYYNANGNKIDLNVDVTQLNFNPANFKLDGTNVNIYAQFGLKEVALTIKTTLDSFEDTDFSKATYTIKRNDEENELTEETGYKFKTNDIMTMTIYPSSVGYALAGIRLDTIFATQTSNNVAYSISVHDILDDDENLTGFYYEFTCEFTPEIIDDLNVNSILTNLLQTKTFDVTYSYNYIDYGFGVYLSTSYGDGSSNTSVVKDVALSNNNLKYGTQITFGWGSLSNLSNFNIVGFDIAGIKCESENAYTLNNDEGLWDDIVLIMHAQGSRLFNVVLQIEPKIVMDNYTKHDQDGYLYQRVYKGSEQGLKIAGDNRDVVVGGDFEIVVQYSTDGINYVSTQPLNVGIYSVKIIAKIAKTTSQGPQEKLVEFSERVTYQITPANVKVKFGTYSKTNPIKKTYNGNTDLDDLFTQICNDLIFVDDNETTINGIFVDRSKINAKMSGATVNSLANLYAVNVSNISMLDSSGKSITNYVLGSGSNISFTGIGLVEPAELKISGFVVKDKVSDGTNNVDVNVKNIKYIGKVEGDSSEIITENLRFYHQEITAEEAKYGVKKIQVFIDSSTALTGADSGNYVVIYDKKYIDIYPREIVCNIENFGTFKVVDQDNLCIIPIGARLYARAHENGSDGYRLAYSVVEAYMEQGNKMHIAYELLVQVGTVTQSIPEGAYVYLPKVKKVTQVIQMPSSQESESLEIQLNEEYTVVKVLEGEAFFGVIVKTTYLPIWAIILIVVGSITIVGILVTVFVIIRRKTKQKYSKYDRI